MINLFLKKFLNNHLSKFMNRKKRLDNHLPLQKMNINLKRNHLKRKFLVLQKVNI